jgi:hypothetical protein
MCKADAAFRAERCCCVRSFEEIVFQLITGGEPNA